MSIAAIAARALAHEARSLLTRLARVRSFVLHETMVPAAALSPAAQRGIERAIQDGRRALAADVHRYLRWIEGPEGLSARPDEMQRRFTFLRLRFNAVLTHFDIFAQALTQRSEHETGVWLAGLDAVARDALSLDAPAYEAPPIVCYLDRGMGAAIRRARTRLPGGGISPIAIVRIPRERMVGTGIGASLLHEVGHQGAALLDLVTSLRAALSRVEKSPAEREAWSLWERWISEIVADFWSIAHLGIGATLGLLSVVSLPPVFVFRPNDDDPHPTPWVRVKLSASMGRALFPHPQWRDVEALWEALYPTDSLPGEQRARLASLEATMDRFVQILLDHRPPSLHGRSLCEAMPIAERRPENLAHLYDTWSSRPGEILRVRPTLAFAALGQARADRRLTPADESRSIAALLMHWAREAALRGPTCPSPSSAVIA